MIKEEVCQLHMTLNLFNARRVDVPGELIFEDTGSVLLVKKMENGLEVLCVFQPLTMLTLNSSHIYNQVKK